MSVRHALLALLSEGPKYGLQLRQEFEAKTGEGWPLNVGQVYTTLQRLGRGGLGGSDGTRTGGPPKGVPITPPRPGALLALPRTPPDADVPPRDELVIKVLVALGVPGVDVGEILQVHRRHLIQTMQRYTRLKENAAEDDVGLALVADAEIFRLEAVVRWLDSADVRLKRFPAATPVEAATPVTRPARRALGARR